MKGVARHFEVHAAKPEETIPFYKDLLSYFEWQVVAEWPGAVGLSDGQVSIWFMATPDELKATPFNRDGTGLNHWGIGVESREAVDTFVTEYLQPRGIEPQFDTPRARPDFGETYYQVMFLDPEGLAIEVYYS